MKKISGLAMLGGAMLMAAEAAAVPNRIYVGADYVFHQNSTDDSGPTFRSVNPSINYETRYPDDFSVPSVNVGYNFSENFGVEAFYQASGDENEHYFGVWNSLDSLSAETDFQAYGVDLMAYFDAEEDKAVKNRMLSIGFQNCRNKIISLVENPDATPDQLQAALADLDSKYGAMVVTETTLGGEMTMKLDADSTFIADEMNIGGMASMSVQAVVSITGEVNADYVRAGEMLLDHSNLSLTMNGGQAAKGQEMAQYLTSSINITRGEVNARTTEWANSIIMDGTNKKNNTAEVVEMTLVPMWSFFEGAAADAVKKYIVDKYKDNPKCMVDFSDY